MGLLIESPVMRGEKRKKVFDDRVEGLQILCLELLQLGEEEEFLLMSFL
jgi:hypothetical protein